MRTRPAAPILLAFALAACADIPAGPAQLTDFDRAFQRWEAAAPFAYRYRVQVNCFCSEARTRPVSVVVIHGQTVSLLYSDSLTPADTVLFSDVRTMDRLFARLRSILDGGPASFAATYDPGLGFPLTVWADPIAQVADEEVGYLVTDFSTFSPPDSPPAESSGAPRPF